MEAGWTNVITTPTLPVKHETKLQLSCEDNYSNKGGEEAECQDGKLSPIDSAPDCRGEKMKTLEISMFKIAINGFYCTAKKTLRVDLNFGIKLYHIRVSTVSNIF